MKIAVVGYGNVGKSLEKIAPSENVVVTAIVSRRKLDNKLFVPFDDVNGVDADVLLLALGSYQDLEQNLHRFKNFHTVDCFDTHKKLCCYKKILNEVKPNKISVCATGWDPGILSLVRGATALCGATPQTRWGKGVSQGHSNALRSIPGVLDAVSVTMPTPSGHKRLCYVACVSSDKSCVEKAIRTMPNYFQWQEVEIAFCSTAEVRKLKADTRHAGEIVAVGTDFDAKFKLSLQNNCDFTAKIMLKYAKIVPQLQKDGFCGALDPFDIPLRYLADTDLI